MLFIQRIHLRPGIPSLSPLLLLEIKENAYTDVRSMDLARPSSCFSTHKFPISMQKYTRTRGTRVLFFIFPPVPRLIVFFRMALEGSGLSIRLRFRDVSKGKARRRGNAHSAGCTRSFLTPSGLLSRVETTRSRCSAIMRSHLSLSLSVSGRV